MIELEALKQQLKLLGHDLPDNQVVSILREMNIDFDLGASSSAPAAPPVNGDAPPRASSGGMQQRDHTTWPGGQQHQLGYSLSMAGEGTSYAAAGMQPERSMLHAEPSASAWVQHPSAGSAGSSHEAPSSMQPQQTVLGSYGSSRPSATADMGMHATGMGSGQDTSALAQLSTDFGRVNLSGAGYKHTTSSSSVPPMHQYSSVAGPAHAHLAPRNPALATQGSSTDVSAEPSFSSSAAADALLDAATAAAAAAPAPKQPHEWYGQLAAAGGAAANPHLTLAHQAHPPRAPSQRSLLQELDQSARAKRAPGAATFAGLGPSLAAPQSSSFWEEDEEEDSQASDYDDRPKHVQQMRGSSRVTFQAGAGASSASARAAAAAARKPAGAPQPARGARGGRGGGGVLESEGSADEEADVRYVRGGGGYGAGIGDDGRRASDEGSDVRAQQDARRGASYGGRPGSGSVKGASAAGLGPADRAALRAAAAAAANPPAPPAAGAGRPVKYQWQDHLRSTSPARSSVLSLPRSSAAASSVAGSRAGSAKGAAKKVDRVKRYQELQSGWSKDNFLKYAQGSKPVPGGRQPSAQTRKPINFHTYFSVLHAIESADRDQMLKQTRSRTKGEMKAGLEFEAPTSKRRDALRWETRLRLQGTDE